MEVIIILLFEKMEITVHTPTQLWALNKIGNECLKSLKSVILIQCHRFLGYQKEGGLWSLAFGIQSQFHFAVWSWVPPHFFFSFLKIILCVLFYVYIYACLSICQVHALPTEARRCWIPWNQTCKQFLATLWVMRMEFRWSTRAGSPPNHWTISSAPLSLSLNQAVSHGICFVKLLWGLSE